MTPSCLDPQCFEKFRGFRVTFSCEVLLFVFRGLPFFNVYSVSYFGSHRRLQAHKVERSVKLAIRGASDRGSRYGFKCVQSKLGTWGDVSRTFFRPFATFVVRIPSHL